MVEHPAPEPHRKLNSTTRREKVKSILYLKKTSRKNSAYEWTELGVKRQKHFLQLVTTEGEHMERVQRKMLVG